MKDLLWLFWHLFIRTILPVVSGIACIIGAIVVVYIARGEPWQETHGLVDRENLKLFLKISLPTFFLSMIAFWFGGGKYYRPFR